MLTPQQVAERTFNANDKRATGYDMQEVDAFMDEITVDYTTLVNENADLRIKLKLLADKVTEYRETENAIRATLYTAQKTATNLVKEAQKKREDILNALEEDIHARKEAYDLEIADCHERLAAARAETAEYVAGVRQIVAEHQRYLDSLPPEIVGGELTDDYDEDNAAVEAAEMAAETAVEQAAEQTAEMAAETAVEQAAEQTAEMSSQEFEEPVKAEDEEKRQAMADTKVFAGIPAAGETAQAARIDFSNLKFGKDYEV